MTKTADANAILDTFKAQLTVIPELKNFLHVLTEKERAGLEEDIVRDGGAREPLIIWKEKQVIVDGHNRYEICTKHKLPYQINEKSFADIEAVKQWMLRNQLHRRNLSPDQVKYFIGLLYNETKQDVDKKRIPTENGITTAEQIANEMNVSEKTVRRAGQEAKGIDTVARVVGLDSVKAKLDAIRGKGTIPAINKDELATIGKIEDPKLAEEVVKETIKVKTETAKAVAKDVAKQKAVKEVAKQPEKTAYSVVFAKPDFGGMGYNLANQVRPPMANDAVLYLAVADEELSKAFDLLKKWGLNYEGSYIFNVDGYEGVVSDVRHTMMLVATRGTMTFPKKLSQSMVKVSGDPDAAMIKMIEGYHGNAKRLDMRDKRNAEGWETLKKTA